MKTNVEKLENNLVKMEIEVDVNEVGLACEEAYRRLKNKVNIPGFRKGKIPKAVFEQRFGKDVFISEAMDDIVTKSYIDAIVEHELDTIDRPDVEVTQAESDLPFIYSATVEVAPVPELGAYKDTEIEKPEYTFDNEKVEEQLSRYQERAAEMEPADDSTTLANGLFAILDFEGFMDGQPMESGKAEGYTLELGAGHFIAGFEENVMGMKKGETKRFTTRFPDDYHAEQYAGKDVEFDVIIQDIKKKVLPDMDDELAKKVSEFDTLEELRSDIANKLKENADKKFEEKKKEAILAKVVENSVIEIPEKMVVGQLDKMVDEFTYNLKRQGLDIDSYFKYTNSDMGKFRDSMKNDAEFRVKADLVIRAIAKAEGIVVSQDDVDNEIERMAGVYQQNPKKLKEHLYMNGSFNELKQALVYDRTVDYLVENTKVIGS